MMQPKALETFRLNFENELSDYDMTALKEENFLGYTLRGKYADKDIRRMKFAKGSMYIPFYNFYIRLDRADDKEGVYVPLHTSVESTLLQKKPGGGYRYILDDSKMNTKLHKPINISSRDDWYINSETGELFKKNRGKFYKSNFKDILKRLSRLNVARYTNIIGFYARLKILVLRKIPIITISILENINASMIWYVNGNFYKYDPMLEAFEDEVENRQSKPKEFEQDRQIDFFGYKVATWTIATFSLLSIIIYLVIAFLDKSEFLQRIDTFSLLSISVAILGIIIFDRMLPFLGVRAARLLGNKDASLKLSGIRIRL